MRALKFRRWIFTAWFVAAMIGVIWQVNANPAVVGGDGGREARIPDLVCKLIKISDETIDPKQSLAISNSLDLIFREPHNFSTSSGLSSPVGPMTAPL